MDSLKYSNCQKMRINLDEEKDLKKLCLRKKNEKKIRNIFRIGLVLDKKIFK